AGTRVGPGRRLRRARLPRCFAELDLQGLPLSVSHDLDVHRLPRSRGRAQVAELTRVANFLARDARHDVAAPKAVLRGGPSRAHPRDQNARRLLEAERLSEISIDVLDRDTEKSARDAALLEQGLHDRPRHVARDREADPHVAASARKDGRWNADELAFEVHERAARVAGIDRGVGLNEVFVLDDTEVRAPLSRDDAHRHGLTDAEGIADGEDDFAEAHGVGVRELERLESAR